MEKKIEDQIKDLQKEWQEEKNPLKKKAFLNMLKIAINRKNELSKMESTEIRIKKIQEHNAIIDKRNRKIKKEFNDRFKEEIACGMINNL